uniref:Endonuclease domain-containing 1 protein-like n=1 Tax=Pelusios castaneus TaxID=367368 RepID=A0A8C8S1W2_9SAUR
MDWRVLLGCISLWAGLVQAEVGTFDTCREYFYHKREPRGFDTDNKAQICQRYNNQCHFATLYDKVNRVPLWSAYIFRRSFCQEQPPRRNKWFVEPQLGDPSKFMEMLLEDEEPALTLDMLKSKQALNEDYEDTSYDRGHLNPNSFHCGDGNVATFTLTNSAPIEPCFNRIRWSKLEKNLKKQLSRNCVSENGTPYLVTGAVPSATKKIPIEDEDKEGDRTREYNRVSVPSHIWTAVCCDHRDSNHKFSFAFLAENKAESRLQFIHVKQLNSELASLYQTSGQISIFADNCNAESQRGHEILSEMRSALNDAFQILLTDGYSQLLPSEVRNRLDQETSQLMKNTNLDQNNMKLTNIRFLMTFPSLADWRDYFEKTYNEDNLACVLAPAAGADPSGVAKASGTSARVCTLQQQKHLPYSGLTAQGWSCVGQVCGYHEGTAYSWCYTSYKKDWDYCCIDKCTVNRGSNQYQCSRGDGELTKCSPQYSTVTVSGKACRADHPCGLYGKSYFWCYTDYQNNWEYCCSPRHYCGNHDYDYQWCYTKDPQASSQHCTP